MRNSEKNRASVKKHYDANKEYYHLKNTKIRQLKAEYLRKQKEVLCKDCNNSYPHYVMEFDHLGDKEYNVSSMTSCGWAKIKEELAKCDIVCANCHSVRTYLRRNITK